MRMRTVWAMRPVHSVRPPSSSEKPGVSSEEKRHGPLVRIGSSGLADHLELEHAALGLNELLLGGLA